VRDHINATYASDRLNDQLTRVGTLIRDVAFTCNTRQLFDAYNGKIKIWMMNYNFLAKYGAAVHASDLLPTFCNKYLDLADLLKTCGSVPASLANRLGPYVKNNLAPAYQSYLKSHAIHDDPNTGAKGGAAKVNWTTATTSGDDDHDHARNIMQPYLPLLWWKPPFAMAPQDPINTASSCKFWNAIAAQIMEIVGGDQDEPRLTIQGADNLPQLGQRQGHSV